MIARLNESSARNGLKHANDNDKNGKIILLDLSDPRNLSHPSHRDQWLKLARVLGRLEAREEYAMIQQR
jgi:hypothetical protein